MLTEKDLKKNGDRKKESPCIEAGKEKESVATTYKQRNAVLVYRDLLLKNHKREKERHEAILADNNSDYDERPSQLFRQRKKKNKCTRC